MTHHTKVTVTDTLGETFPLRQCEYLCIRYGESDYGDPRAILYPDGETAIMDFDLNLTDENGADIQLEDVDFKGRESPEKGA
jgi:hypothetical protein